MERGQSDAAGKSDESGLIGSLSELDSCRRSDQDRDHHDDNDATMLAFPLLCKAMLLCRVLGTILLQMAMKEDLRCGPKPGLRWTCQPPLSFSTVRSSVGRALSAISGMYSRMRFVATTGLPVPAHAKR